MHSSRWVGFARGAFPDLQFDVYDVSGGKDRAVARWTMRATHLGELAGSKPTGKQVSQGGTGSIGAALSKSGVRSTASGFWNNSASCRPWDRRKAQELSNELPSLSRQHPCEDG
jgi:SnoaL-like polyketide cyclase